MNITEQAATVLQKIDAALAICEKATDGPWQADGFNLFALESGAMIADLYEIDGAHEDDGNGDFIASARTVCPKSLRMLKTAIEGLLKLTIRPPGDTPDEVCHTIDGYADDAEEILTTLINQWNSK